MDERKGIIRRGRVNNHPAYERLPRKRGFLDVLGRRGIDLRRQLRGGRESGKLGGWCQFHDGAPMAGASRRGAMGFGPRLRQLLNYQVLVEPPLVDACRPGVLVTGKLVNTLAWQPLLRDRQSWGVMPWPETSSR